MFTIVNANELAYFESGWALGAVVARLVYTE
jgi:hypothetical protein